MLNFDPRGDQAHTRHSGMQQPRPSRRSTRGAQSPRWPLPLLPPEQCRCRSWYSPLPRSSDDHHHYPYVPFSRSKQLSSRRRLLGTTPWTPGGDTVQIRKSTLPRPAVISVRSPRLSGTAEISDHAPQALSGPARSSTSACPRRQRPPSAAHTVQLVTAIHSEYSRVVAPPEEEVLAKCEDSVSASSRSARSARASYRRGRRVNHVRGGQRHSQHHSPLHPRS